MACSSRGEHALSVTFRKRKINVFADPQNEKPSASVLKFQYQPLLELESDSTCSENNLLLLSVTMWSEELEEKIYEELGSIYQTVNIQMMPLDEVKLEWRNPPNNICFDDPVSLDHCPMVHVFTVECQNAAAAKIYANQIRRSPQTLARGLHVSAICDGQKSSLKINLGCAPERQQGGGSNDADHSSNGANDVAELMTTVKENIAQVEEKLALSLNAMNEDVKQYHDNMENRFTHLETTVNQVAQSTSQDPTREELAAVNELFRKLELDVTQIQRDQRVKDEETKELKNRLKATNDLLEAANDQIKELKIKLEKTTTKSKDFTVAYSKQILTSYRQDYMTVIPAERDGAKSLLITADCRKDASLFCYDSKRINTYLSNKETIRGLGTSNDGRLYVLVFLDDGSSYLKQYRKKVPLAEDYITDIITVDAATCHLSFVLKNDVAYIQTQTKIFAMPLDEKSGLIDRNKMAIRELPDNCSSEWINSFDVNDRGEMFLFCYRRRRLLYLDSDCGLLDGFVVDLPDLPFPPHLVFPHVLSDSSLLLSVSPKVENKGALILVEYDRESFQGSKIIFTEIDSILCDLQIVDDELAVRHYDRSSTQRALRLYKIN
ncbi:uncharacterized protein LOC141899400 [Tubulanus polymorphus]|uniref:uncharacterized protein LOC141899400 n=1 Tax=Tubulanus polymorphus TaxID=672921 RepID=UPI003DA34F74